MVRSFPSWKKTKKKGKLSKALALKKTFTAAVAKLACSSPSKQTEPDSKSVLSHQLWITNWVAEVEKIAFANFIPTGRTSLSLCSQNRKNSFTSGMFNSHTSETISRIKGPSLESKRGAFYFFPRKRSGVPRRTRAYMKARRKAHN